MSELQTFPGNMPAKFEVGRLTFYQNI